MIEQRGCTVYRWDWHCRFSVLRGKTVATHRSAVTKNDHGTDADICIPSEAHLHVCGVHPPSFGEVAKVTSAVRKMSLMCDYAGLQLFCSFRTG